MRVSPLPDDDRDCGWIATLPPLPPAERVRGARSADWVVLGAGFTGLAAARRLAAHLPEAHIVLLDAQRAGQGASGRNAGFIIDVPHHVDSGDDADLALNRRTVRLARAAIAELGELVRQHGIDCQWSERGKWHCAVEDRGIAALEQFKRCFDALGEPYAELDAEHTAAVLGTRYYRRAVHAPGCVLMQPAALTRGLAASLPRNTVEVLEESPVVEVDYGPTIRLSCPEGTLTTGNLILATNGFTAGLGFLKGRLVPIFTTGSLTRPLTEAEQRALGGENDWGVIAGDRMGTTLRYTRDRRLFVRNTFAYWPRMSMTDGERARMRRRHEAAFRARFPMLPEVGFEYTWGGNLCMSRNAAPFFGKLAANVWAAVCHNGVGVAKGTISGSLIADYVVGADSELLQDILAFPRPARSPPRPFLDLGARLMLAWQQHRAGRER